MVSMTIFLLIFVGALLLRLVLTTGIEVPKLMTAAKAGFKSKVAKLEADVFSCDIAELIKRTEAKVEKEFCPDGKKENKPAPVTGVKEGFHVAYVPGVGRITSDTPEKLARAVEVVKADPRYQRGLRDCKITLTPDTVREANLADTLDDYTLRTGLNAGLLTVNECRELHQVFKRKAREGHVMVLGQSPEIIRTNRVLTREEVEQFDSLTNMLHNINDMLSSCHLPAVQKSLLRDRQEIWERARAVLGHQEFDYHEFLDRIETQERMLSDIREINDAGSSQRML